MAVEGDLKDISLTGLVQVVCLERRTGELVIARRGEEGVIFFEKGEIVHAKSGTLIGEEALFHMLSWHDGSFRINDKVTVMAKTISINWNHLLMEGMRRIDERKWEVEAPPMLPPPSVALGCIHSFLKGVSFKILPLYTLFSATPPAITMDSHLVIL